MSERVFQRHPAAAALDEFMASDEWQLCTRPGAHGVYLENRLKSAFMAGWNACEKNKTEDSTHE